MTRTLRHLQALLALSLTALPLIAAAVDTREPYPSGPSTLEVYGIRYGHGEDADADRGIASVMGLAWGLDPSSDAYLFTGLRSSDEQLGGIDFLALGLFHNLYSGEFKLDAYGELRAFGPGLALVSRLAGLEYNLDMDGWGLLARTAWQWESDGVNQQGEAVVGRRAKYSEAIYYRSSAVEEIFYELTQEAMKEFANSGDHGTERTSMAFGYNRVVGRQMELILEARRFVAPPGGERTWDFTLGAVLIW